MLGLITTCARQVVPSVVATLIAAAIISIYNHAFSERVPMTRVPRLAPEALADLAPRLTPSERVEQAFADERRASRKEVAVDSPKRRGPAGAQPMIAPPVAQPATPGQTTHVKPARPEGPTVATLEPTSPAVIRAPLAPAPMAHPPMVQAPVAEPTVGVAQPPRPSAQVRGIGATPVIAGEQTFAPMADAAPFGLIDRGARLLAAIEAAGNAILPSIRN